MSQWKDVHLQHKDRVKTKFRTINGALNKIETETDGFIVDLTAPKLMYLNDGSEAKVDAEYQVCRQLV